MLLRTGGLIALRGVMAASLWHLHLLNFKHIKLGFSKPLACWTCLKYPKDEDPFLSCPIEVGKGKAGGWAWFFRVGRRRVSADVFSLGGWVWLGFSDKGRWCSVGSAEHWIWSRALSHKACAWATHCRVSDGVCHWFSVLTQLLWKVASAEKFLDGNLLGKKQPVL